MNGRNPGGRDRRESELRFQGNGISPKRSASLLDTFSCIFQGTIPYGAQMLVAISTCATLGYAISAFDIIPLLF